MKNVAIIGGGEIGQAVFFLLKKGAKVEMFDKETKENCSDKPLSSIVQSADIIFLAVPAGALPSVLSEIKNDIQEDSVLVILSKGLIGDKPVPLYASEDAGLSNFVVMGGPMLAEEILAGKRAYAVAASNRIQLSEEIAALFSDSALSIETSEDVIGVSVAGVLKNIYSVFLGMMSARAPGENLNGYYSALAFKEMARLTLHYGGLKETVYGTAGLADFLATSNSNFSRNYMVGIKIAGGDYSTESEGTLSLPAVVRNVQSRLSEYPLLNALNEIILNKKDANEFLEKAVL